MSPSDYDKLKKAAEDRRPDFLIAMYKELMGDINRHIMVVWQSVATVAGSLIFLSLSEQGKIDLEYSATIIFIVAFWQIAHIYDSNYWYNRNLAMIANIERLFLYKDDLRFVHYYFGKHRSENKMIGHLKVQMFLAISVIITACVAYYIHLDFFSRNPRTLNIEEALPLFALVAGVIYTSATSHRNRRAYKEFIENSPGVDIDTIGIRYGEGHPTNNN